MTKNPIVWDITVKLGYPAHFIYILGVAKVSGIIVLLTPNKLLRLKEGVFAGVYFDILFAFFSKLAVLNFTAAIDAIVAFLMVTVTYLMFRKLCPAAYPLPSPGASHPHPGPATGRFICKKIRTFVSLTQVQL